jgi:hypothetical protein
LILIGISSGESKTSLKNGGWIVSQMNREYENQNKSGQRKQYQPEGLSLKGYYAIAVLSVIIGIAIVGVLNLATPLQIITNRLEYVSGLSGPSYLLASVGPLLFLLLVCVFFLIVLRVILRPISRYLKLFKSGHSLPEGPEENAGASALLDVIIGSLDHFRDGFKLQDDVTLIVVKI